MTASWVAAGVRARALGRRRLGRVGARSLAATGSVDAAVEALADTAYGRDVRPGQDLAAAQHAVAACLLWNLRVLAGWLPREGVDAVRLLVRWFEIANVDALLAAWHDAEPASPSAGAAPAYRLGTLGTSWTALSGAASMTDLRDRLARTPWGDPGGDGRWEVQVSMRLGWADRLAATVPATQQWAAGAAALLLAREAVVGGRALPPPASVAAARLLGVDAAGAASLPELAARLPATARWAVREVTHRDDLWAAETRWWRRVEDDASALARSARFGFEPVLGAVALLAVDAWRVRAALELAGRGGGPPGVLDAVA